MSRWRTPSWAQHRIPPPRCRVGRSTCRYSPTARKRRHASASTDSSSRASPPRRDGLVWGPDTPPPSLGAMTWSASASGTYDEGVGAGALSLAIDGSAPEDSPAPPIASASKPDVSISDGAAPTALDVAIRRAEARGPRPEHRPIHIVLCGRARPGKREVASDTTRGGRHWNAERLRNGDGTSISSPIRSMPVPDWPLLGEWLRCSPVATSFVAYIERGRGVLDVSVDLIDAPPGSTDLRRRALRAAGGRRAVRATDRATRGRRPHRSAARRPRCGAPAAPGLTDSGQRRTSIASMASVTRPADPVFVMLTVCGPAVSGVL